MYKRQAADRTNDRQRRQQGAQLRQQLKPLREAVRLAETLVEKANRKKATIDAKLANPELYEPAQKDELKRLLIEKSRIEQETEAAESAWLSHADALETAERETAA